MCKVSIAIGENIENSVQVKFNLDLAWGPKLHSRVQWLVNKLLSRLKLPGLTKANLAIAIKNEIAYKLEDVIKYGSKINPKLEQLVCKRTNRVVKFKLAVS